MKAGWLCDHGRAGQGMVIEERMKAGWLCDQGRAGHGDRGENECRLAS